MALSPDPTGGRPQLLAGNGVGSDEPPERHCGAGPSDEPAGGEAGHRNGAGYDV